MFEKKVITLYHSSVNSELNSRSSRKSVDRLHISWLIYFTSNMLKSFPCGSLTALHIHGNWAKRSVVVSLLDIVVSLSLPTSTSSG